MPDRVNLTLPPHHTQVDPKWAKAILAEHQPKIPHLCNVCIQRWPCEIGFALGRDAERMGWDTAPRAR